MTKGRHLVNDVIPGGDLAHLGILRAASSCAQRHPAHRVILPAASSCAKSQDPRTKTTLPQAWIP
jgi:hypothetical protein